jgi:hypothetical protein
MTQLNRRQLFVLVGLVPLAGCNRSRPVPEHLDSSESTVTLLVEGMV